MNSDEEGRNQPQKIDGIIDDTPAQYERKSFKASERYETSGSYAEDEMTSASKDMDDFDDIFDAVTEFEEISNGAKSRINKMEKINQNVNVLPQTLKMCFQIANRHANDGLSSLSGSASSLDQSIQNLIKNSINCARDFNKFKNEYFTLNEPIANKDISTLKLSTIKTQAAKLDRCVDKLAQMENNQESHWDDLQQLKHDYEALEQELFEEKFQRIEATKEKAHNLRTEIIEKYDESRNEIEAAKEQAKSVTPLTKEQRLKLAEFNSKIQRVERKYGKLGQLVKQFNEMGEEYTADYEKAQQILAELKPQVLKEMLNQTRKLDQLAAAEKQGGKYLAKLEQTEKDNDIVSGELKDMNLQLDDYVSSFQSGMSEEFTHNIDQIFEKVEALGNDIATQNDRLSTFEDRISDIKISDADQFFLNKEIMRYRNAISSVEANSETVHEAASLLKQQIESREGNRVNCEDLEEIKNNFKKVEKLETYEFPKIVKNIEGLEMFMIKSLKNQLNDDNKKSQVLISKMKKNYETFQKQFEQLILQYGNCRSQVDSFDEKFDTEDLERINEIQLIEDKLYDEDLNIYGKSEADTTAESSTLAGEGEESIQKMKKSIIGNINKLVSQFNENNKLLKESSKQVKTEEALNVLIAKNKTIQNDCQEIHSKIDEGKQMAASVGERIATIVNPQIIESLILKYTQKNNQVLECSKVETKSVNLLDKIDMSIQKSNEQVEKILKKLDSVNPINNPSSANEVNQEFLKEISDKIDETNQIKEELERQKEQFTGFIDSIDKAMQPIQFMGEREVPLSPEIEDIQQAMETIYQQITELEIALGPVQARVAKMQKAIEANMEQEISRKLKIGQQTVAKLDKTFDETTELKNGVLKKTRYYRDQLEKARTRLGATDPLVTNKLDELNDEQLLIEKELNEIESKLKDHRRKRGDAKKAIDEIEKAPGKFVPAQIDNMLVNLDELQDKTSYNDEKLKNVNKNIEQKIKDLEGLLESNESKKLLMTGIETLTFELNDDLENLKEAMDKLPEQIKGLKAALEEMKQSTGPGGDYSEKKEEIDEYMDELEELGDDTDKMYDSYNKLFKGKDQIAEQLKNSKSIESIKKVSEALQERKNEVANIQNDANDVLEQLNELRRDLGDCEIDTNITKRKNELSIFVTKLDRMQKEFKNLKKANEKNFNKQVADMIKEGDFKLKAFDKDKADHTKVLSQDLETINKSEFEDFSKNHEIMKRIRAFRGKINDSEKKLSDIAEIQNEVTRTLTEQDMENSVELLGLSSAELYERLTKSKAHLKLISKGGEEMDGNTSNAEEEEFISALANEMPEVFQNIETTLGLLEEIDKLVNEVRKTLNITTYNDLQSKVKIVTENVEESESLVLKLEKEIIEWNAAKKLQRRDVELDEIQLLCSDFIDDLGQEKQNTDIELEKNREKQAENVGQDMVDKDGNKVDIMQDLLRLAEQMTSYNSEIDVILKDILQLDDLKDRCLQEFNCELPKSIKDLRKLRKQEEKINTSLKRPANLLLTQKLKKKKDAESQEQNDIYQMLSLNCRFKKRIQNMLKDLKEINNRRKDLEDRYSQMRKEVFKIKQIKLYKPVRGDVVDEMFAGYLNKAKIEVEVQRTSAGNYLFGTKKILAKIINGRLVIRVGGGYMNAEEFIEQYGKIEMMKVLKLEQKQKETDSGFGGARASVTGGDKRTSVQPNSQMANDIKEKMRQSLLKVQPYQTQTTTKDNLSSTQQNKNSLTGKSITTYKSQAQGEKPRPSAGAKEMTDTLKKALIGVKSKAKLGIEIEDNVALSNALSPKATMKPRMQQTPLSSRNATRQSISGLPSSMMNSIGKGSGLASTRNSILAPSSSSKDLRFADGRKSTMALTKDEDKIKPGVTRTTMSGHKRPASNMGFTKNEQK